MIISWGKPRLAVAKIESGSTTIPTSGWKLLPTPAQDSTVLTTEKGEKKEAKIEGGENEAVRYLKSTYALEFKIRAGVGRKKPFADNDGVIEGVYALALQPENPAAPGLYIGEGVLSVLTEFTAEEGLTYTYTLDATTNSQKVATKALDQCTEATITITEGETGDITVTVTPVENEQGGTADSE